MRTSGSSKGGRFGLALAFLSAIAGVAVAAEVWTVEAPEGESYTACCTLAPGADGAEVCGDDRGNGHIDFRVGFGADLNLNVNGVDGGPFNPEATYSIVVQCAKIGCSWFASTTIVNEATGEPVFQQMNYKMPGAPQEVRAEAADVIGLSIS
jgi:hypothetical protein